MVFYHSLITYLLSKLASKSIKVVLSGDGGDELLAGYSYWYSNIDILEKYLNNSNNYLYKFFKKISPFNNFNNTSKAKKLYNHYGSLENLYFSQRECFNSNDLQQFGFKSTDEFVTEEMPRSLDEVLRLDIKNYLPGDILVKTDRASMANGLEIRSPFLDVDLASFCISLTQTLKLKNGHDKVLLRQAFKNDWPRIYRRTKKAI